MNEYDNLILECRSCHEKFRLDQYKKEVSLPKSSTEGAYGYAANEHLICPDCGTDQHGFLGTPVIVGAGSVPPTLDNDLKAIQPSLITEGESSYPDEKDEKDF